MTTPILTSPLSELVASPLKKKRVLLVDTAEAKRGLRAEAMRKLGIEVDCAADIGEARSWWRADLYNLVIINTACELICRDEFCEDMRGAVPPQQLAFLVGKPDYLADSPNADGSPSLPPRRNQTHEGDVKTAFPPDIPGGVPQRWGILEASRRISAVRSLSHARSRAERERPAPPRDLETRYTKHTAAWSQVLPELQKEEIQ
jgi:hypothetical protein